MADVKWIKITTDIFDDEKILLIESLPDGDSLIVIWFKLLCLAGKQNNGGIFTINDKIPYTEEMLATIFRKSLTTVKLALETFEKFNMIETVNGIITIPKWDKHQNEDKLEKIREQTRQRVAAHRERTKAITECNVTETLHVTLRNATDKEEDIEEEKNKNNKKEKQEKRKGFVPPTVDEVRAYCEERNNNVDPEQFFYWYESNGWMVGKTKMKDWKASVVTWEKRHQNDRKDHHVTLEEMDTWV